MPTSTSVHTDIYRRAMKPDENMATSVTATGLTSVASRLCVNTGASSELPSSGRGCTIIVVTIVKVSVSATVVTTVSITDVPELMNSVSVIVDVSVWVLMDVSISVSVEYSIAADVDTVVALEADVSVSTTPIVLVLVTYLVE